MTDPKPTSAGPDARAPIHIPTFFCSPEDEARPREQNERWKREFAARLESRDDD